MKIQRTINGTTYMIELLPDELADAYIEQRNKFDIEDIVSYGEEMPKQELEETFGCTYDEFLSLKQIMALQMRRNMDEYGMPFAYAREYAIKEVINKNKVAV